MSYVLNTNELIIENILKYLPYRQLKTLMKLNSHWHSAAQRLLRKRNRPSFLYWNRKDANPIAVHYSNFLNDMYAAPDTVMTFSTEDFDSLKGWRRINPSKKRRIDCEAFLKHEIERAIEQAVDPGIGKIHITSYAAVGVSKSENNAFPGVFTCLKLPAATSVFWPKRDDLSIRVMTSLDEVPQGILPERDDLSLKLFLFLYDHTFDGMERKSWPMKCVVAGCKVSSLKYNGHQSPMLGISFFGRPSIQAASVIVRESENELEIVEKRLMELIPFLKKKFCRDETDAEFNIKEFSHRIHGYVFVCADRLPSHRKRGSVDLMAFAKVFPEVPLFGVACYGEIGMNVRDEKDLCEREKFTMNDHLYFVSSVFVLLAM